ncbi:MAG: YbaB/EbfC family nucleoid-associated protein [Actinomycetota bacterium]|nr:YbaB/EbfC family nucleoid-associated protein [Actinomycetota bacterium]
MFPGGPMDMQQMLQQVQKLQQQMLDAQDELGRTHVEGTAGGGLVAATVTGTGELVGLQIRPEAIDPDDPETLADLVLAAVRDATTNAAELQSKTMTPLTQGLGGLSGSGGPSGGSGGLGLPGM